MATYTSTSTGGTFDSGWIHARVEAVTSYTDTSTTVTVTVKCYAVPAYSSVASSWIYGKATKNSSGTYGNEANVSLNGSTVLMKTESFSVTRDTSDKTITCKAYLRGAGTGIYNGDHDEASVSVTIPKLKSYVVSYNGNKPSAASGSVSNIPSNQTKWQGINLALSKNIPSLTNYNFKGWAESSTGSVIISPGATFTYSGNANKTYYAIWELAYILPTITNVEIFRTAESTSTTLAEEGTYMRVNFSWNIDTNVQNTGIIATISAKLKGASETTYRICAENEYTGASGNYGLTLQFKDENKQSIPFSIESSYDIKIEITDTYGGTTIIYRTLSQSYVLLDFSPNGGIGIGMTAPEIKELDLGIGFKHFGDSVSLESSAKNAWINALGLGVELVYEDEYWTILRYGHTIMVQIHGYQASGNGSVSTLSNILVNYKPSYNCSTICTDASGDPTHLTRMWVNKDTGGIAFSSMGYTTSTRWYGTLTYIYRN